MSATLPLESIRVASPCSVSWDAMTGDERKRFCGQCSRHVFNLSGLDRAAAEELVGGAAQAGERVCVRFFVRPDGTVLTADCPVGKRARGKRLALVGAALTSAAAVVAGVVAGVAGRGEDGRDKDWFEPSQNVRMVMGEMIAPPPRATPAPVASPGTG